MAAEPNNALFDIAMPDKLQREIEDLLSRLDDLPSGRPIRARVTQGVSGAVRGFASLFTGLRLPRVSLGQVLLAGIALIIIGYVLNPGDASVTRIVIVAGIVLFLGAFVLSLRRQSRPPEKRWRGVPMELGGSRAGDRLRSWWDRWRTRR